jgi:hypothetical protein
MRKMTCAAVALLSGLVLSSCTTAYRYEYYDYKGKTIDEKNKARMDKIDQRFQGVMPDMGTRTRR